MCTHKDCKAKRALSVWWRSLYQSNIFYGVLLPHCWIISILSLNLLERVLCFGGTSPLVPPKHCLMSDIFLTWGKCLEVKCWPCVGWGWTHGCVAFDIALYWKRVLFIFCQGQVICSFKNFPPQCHAINKVCFIIPRALSVLCFPYLFSAWPSYWIYLLLGWASNSALCCCAAAHTNSVWL